MRRSKSPASRLSITSDHENFYILANKLNDKLGYYILKINQQDPFKYCFLINWSRKLDINDGDLSIMKETVQVWHDEKGRPGK